MSSPPAVPDRGNLRASDADRERVADILREAAGDGRLTMEELDERLDAVYAAKTYAELEPITRDLPRADAAQAPAPAPVPGEGLPRVGGVPSSSGAFAILGGFSRKGDWVVPKEFSAVAIMSGGEIDLREARFAEPVVTIHAITIMGGIEIIVPEDVTVQVTGIGVMGAFEHVASGEGNPGGPKIIVNGVAIMGAVDVRRKRSRQPEELDPGRDYRQARLDARHERLEARRDYRQERRDARRDDLRARREHRRPGELD